jgi:hypothetical protein
VTMPALVGSGSVGQAWMTFMEVGLGRGGLCRECAGFCAGWIGGRLQSIIMQDVSETRSSPGRGAWASCTASQVFAGICVTSRRFNRLR